MDHSYSRETFRVEILQYLLFRCPITSWSWLSFQVQKKLLSLVCVYSDGESWLFWCRPLTEQNRFQLNDTTLSVPVLVSGSMGLWRKKGLVDPWDTSEVRLLENRNTSLNDRLYIPHSFVYIQKSVYFLLTNCLFLSGMRDLQAIRAAQRSPQWLKAALLSAILHPKKLQSDSGKGWGTYQGHGSMKMMENTVSSCTVTCVCDLPPPPAYGGYWYFFTHMLLTQKSMAHHAFVDFIFLMWLNSVLQPVLKQSEIQKEDV